MIQIITYVQLLALAWMIWQLAPEHVQRVMLMRGYLLGAMVSALGTLTMRSSLGGGAREAAFNMNPNDIGLRMALAIPIALYLAATEKRALPAWAYRLAMIIASAALFRTASRGALVSFCIAMLMIPLTILEVVVQTEAGDVDRARGRRICIDLARFRRRRGNA